MIRVIEEYTAYELQEAVNNFLKRQNVYATQTHIVFEGEGKQTKYIAVLYYNEVKKNE